MLLTPVQCLMSCFRIVGEPSMICTHNALQYMRRYAKAGRRLAALPTLAAYQAPGILKQSGICIFTAV